MGNSLDLLLKNEEEKNWTTVGQRGKRAPATEPSGCSVEGESEGAKGVVMAPNDAHTRGGKQIPHAGGANARGNNLNRYAALTEEE